MRDLLEHGFAVTVVDNFSKYGYVEHDFYAHPNCQLVVQDVRTLYPSQFRGYDYVLCLAALIGGIQYFHELPYRIARDNTHILTQAIDSMLAASPGALLVYFSSSMVYERLQRPVTEEDALTQPVPLTSYGMQKLFGEYLVRGAHQEFGLNYLIVRPFNAVGSGELPHLDSTGHVRFGVAHVIPDFVYKALHHQSPFQILGDGEQVRTFTHARDIATGVRLMLEKDVRNEDFNLCGSTTCRIGDLAQVVWARINPGLPFPGFEHLPAPPTDVRFRVGTANKAKTLLGWSPTYDLNQIVDDTAQFIRRHISRSRTLIA